jgi:hypothetical protein
MTELLAGGSISVDEDGNGTIEKVFKDWTNYEFTKSPGLNPVTDPKDNLRVSATGTYIPGVSGSATLNYTVVNNALNVAPTSANTTWFATLNYTIVGGLNLTPLSGNTTWNAGVGFDFTVTSAGYVPIVKQMDALTGASVTGPTTGTPSSVSFNGADISGNSTVTPGSPVTDEMTLGPINTHTAMNNLTLLARRTTGVAGTASVTSFSQTFTQVVIPEPGTVAGLLVAGGLGLAMKRRQKDS